MQIVASKTTSICTMTYTDKDNKKHQVRTLVTEEGKLWFVAIDACKAMGFVSPQHKITRKIERRFKRYIEIADTLGRDQITLLINEQGINYLLWYNPSEDVQRFFIWLQEQATTKCLTLVSDLKVTNRIVSSVLKAHSKLRSFLNKFKPLNNWTYCTAKLYS